MLAPGLTGLCSAMPDPGTVPGQLGGRLCLGTVPGSARGCQGTSGDTHHPGKLLGDTLSRTPAASAALCAGIAAPTFPRRKSGDCRGVLWALLSCRRC